MVKRVLIPNDEEIRNNIPKSREDWKNQFYEMKRDLRQVKQRYIPIPFLHPDYGDNEEMLSCLYCHFINDILDNIRAGEIDYCYYIYQIEDILKYEPRLKSCWLEQEQCFRVWI